MKKLMTLIACVAAAAAWSACAQDRSADPARGKAAYLKYQCDSCHGTAGQGTRFGVRLAPNPLPWEAFSHEVRHPREAMPRYPAQHLSDAEIADMIAYLGAIKPGMKASDIPLLKE